MVEDSHGELAHQRLAVGSAFTGDNEVGPFDRLAEMEGLKQQLDARPTLSMHVLHEGVAKASGGSCTRLAGTVVAEMPGRGFCKSSGPLVEQQDHFGRGSLLPGKHVCGAIVAIKRIGNVGGNGEPYGLQLLDVVPRSMPGKGIDECAKHADACIAGGTAAKSDNDMAGPSPDGIGHQQARAIAGGRHRVALFVGEQGQSAGLCRLYHRLIIAQQIAGLDGAHQWVSCSHLGQLSAYSGMESCQEALATVAHRNLYGLSVRANASDALGCCLIGLM